MKNYRNYFNEKTFFYFSLILTVFVRLRFADAPLERDEGEYAYAGMMILRGQLPYADFYNMKLPGVYYLYALAFKLCGQSVVVIRCLLLTINLLSTFFVFKTAQNWLSRSAAWWASGVFLLLSFSFHAQGWIANCEQFVNLFVAASLYFLTKKWSPPYLFACGLMLGFATLMKQHAFHFGLFPAFLWLKEVFDNRNFAQSLRSAFALGLGYALPLVATVGYFWQKGIFDAFYFYIVQYATAYSTLKAKIFDNIDNIAFILVDNALLWLLLLTTVFRIVKQSFTPSKLPQVTAFEGVKSENTEGLFLCILTGIAFVSVCPGWYFRLHYFHYLFVPSALLMAYSLSNYDKIMGKFAQKVKRPLFVGVSLLLSFVVQIEYIMLKTPDYVTSTMYRWGYFTEIRHKMGRFLSENMKEGDVLGQLTYEPELWFYTKTKAASGFLYAYPLIETHAFAEQLVQQYIRETEANNPEWFVYMDLRYDAKYTPTSIQLDNWAKNYLKNYELKAVMYDEDKLKARFDTNFFNIDTTKTVFYGIYKKKNEY